MMIFRARLLKKSLNQNWKLAQQMQLYAQSFLTQPFTCSSSGCKELLWSIEIHARDCFQALAHSHLKRLLSWNLIRHPVLGHVVNLDLLFCNGFNSENADLNHWMIKIEPSNKCCYDLQYNPWKLQHFHMKKIFVTRSRTVVVINLAANSGLHSPKFKKYLDCFWFLN